MARVARPGGVVAILEHNPFNPLTRLAVYRCEFDDGVELLSRRATVNLMRQAKLELAEAKYIVFFPWRDALLRSLESRLGALPLGAQYAVAGVKRQTDVFV
jgi:uncharacterized protein (DUF2062 family)